MAEQFALAALFGFLIALASYFARFLTLTGSLATFVLAVVIYGAGGWQWTVPILTFFVLSSLLSKFGRSRKARFELAFEKTGVRDAGQVMANGGIAGLIAALSFFFPEYEFYPYYLGALAGVTADTWGTEIGLLAGGGTTSVITLKPVPPGTSGGISNEGVIAGGVGALVIALSGYYWFGDVRTAFAVVVAGMVGSLSDSLLGATLQAQYRCSKCGALIERTEHCNRPASQEKGFQWVNNDLVNWFCALTGALVVWGMTLL
jgi:uncharacterized protein (TIGR00297 family)